jgi:hypothetical protein
MKRHKVEMFGTVALVAVWVIVGLPAPVSANTATLFTDVGPAPADIQGTVDAFRTALGTLNPNNPVPSGRRRSTDGS